MVYLTAGVKFQKHMVTEEIMLQNDVKVTLRTEFLVSCDYISFLCDIYTCNDTQDFVIKKGRIPHSVSISFFSSSFMLDRSFCITVYEYETYAM